ncbi:MAG: DUF4998 domain-containing protein [Mangrovibacterium sp.]
MSKIIRYLLFIFILSSCDDLNDIHQKYLEDGSKAYPGVTDNLMSFPGKGRVKLTWYQNSDPRIKETVIYWNQRNDSIIKPFNRIGIGSQKDSVMIENLAEGTHTFELINKTDQSERSLVSAIQGISYGEQYEKGLRGRPVSSITRTGTKSETARIIWGTQPSTPCIGTKVWYKKSSTGEDVEFFVNSATTQSDLDDVGNRLLDPDEMIYMASLYCPNGSVDTLQSPTYKHQIVVYTVTLGYRREYSATGVPGTVTAYGLQAPSPNIIEKFFWFTSNQDDILYCNRFGSFGAATDFTLFQYRLTLNDDNTFDIGGYSYTNATTLSYTIMNTDEVSTFDPETGKLQLYNKRVLATTGASTVFEEELVPKI